MNSATNGQRTLLGSMPIQLILVVALPGIIALHSLANNDPPMQWEPVSANTLRTSQTDGDYEMVFTSDLRSFLYQTPGGELRTGTKIE